MFGLWNLMQYAVFAVATPLSNLSPFRLLLARTLRCTGLVMHSIVLAYLLHYTLWKASSEAAGVWILIVSGGLFFYLSIGKPLYEAHLRTYQDLQLGVARVIRFDFVFLYCSIVLFAIISAIRLLEPGSGFDQTLDRVVRWIVDVPLLSGLILFLALLYAVAVLWQGVLMAFAMIITPVLERMQKR